MASARPETQHGGKRLLPPEQAPGEKQPVSKEREGWLHPPRLGTAPCARPDVSRAGDGTESCLETGERQRKIHLREHEVKVN